MPNETWWNLPADKRDRITSVAMAEFASKGFSAGSLNVIAREAEIAKGSLFQYFNDKLDFFATICEIGSTRIEQATVGAIDADRPFFDLLRELVVDWVRYFRSHPLERGIAYAAANEVNAEARQAVRSVTNSHYDKALRPLVERAQTRGEIRPDMDAAIVISMITLVLRHFNSAPFDPVGDPAVPFAEMSAAEVEDVALAVVATLERAFIP